VVEAVDAEEAVELLGVNHSIALVFSDINMPGAVDGNDLAAWVSSRFPDVKLLLTSGIGREGGPPFIPKPYSFVELQRRIEAILPTD
jgi:CheY-like chemotaxis protein